MICNFRADHANTVPTMPQLPFSTPSGHRRPRAMRPGAARSLLPALAAAALACAAAPTQAEKADRSKPMSIESNGAKPDVVDLNKHSAVFTGNVVITQGTLQIHADRVEVSEDPNGERLGFAFGSPGSPARFRQKRDRPDEWSEGDAQRIEYDSAANRVRFIGDAHLRMLRGDAVTDTASAALITYDTAADTIALNGGGSRAPENGASSTSAGGRTTVVFTPRPASGAAAPAPKPLELPPAASGAGQ
jgi:lipopolysaccharide export system protein LptA